MRPNGVELLKYQFSKAIDQTFEQFLDSWTLPVQEEAPIGFFSERHQSPVEIPLSDSI